MDLGLGGHACIVTGGSRGIGAATAEVLAGEGASVLLVARDGAALAAVAERCREAGGSAESLVLDVTGRGAGERALRACEEAFGRVDALVCGAGTSALKDIPELTDEDWQAQWELHVMAPMRMMRAVAPHMAERGGGRIVNVASSSGKRPSSTNAAYSVTKAAQLSLSRAFANRYASDGVLVNAVAPGPVGSELWLGPDGLAAQQAAAQGVSSEEAVRRAAAKVPVGRLGTPEEIAAVIALLCSPRAAFVAGAAWSVDGGSVPVII